MKMKKIVLACGLVALSSSAAAEVSFSGNVALVSDYIFRGVTQTADDPAIQGGFDAEVDNGLYAGVWGSNVTGYAGSSMELDLYFGWAGEFEGVGVDVGYLRYQYPGTTAKTNNTDEYHIGLSYDFGPAAVSGTFNYSPDFYGFDNANYWAFGLDIPVNDTVSLSATYGITDYDDNSVANGSPTDYNDWSVGISAAYQGFDFGLTYTDVDDSTVADSAVVFSISKSL